MKKLLLCLILISSFVFADTGVRPFAGYFSADSWGVFAGGINFGVLDIAGMFGTWSDDAAAKTNVNTIAFQGLFKIPMDKQTNVILGGAFYMPGGKSGGQDIQAFSRIAAIVGVQHFFTKNLAINIQTLPILMQNFKVGNATTNTNYFGYGIQLGLLFFM